MPAIRTPNAKQQFWLNDGSPASGAKLYTYAANTITPQPTYTNRAGTVANTNPIILDARGEATIFLTPGVVYDYVLKTADEVTIWTQDDITADAGDADAVTFVQSGTGAITRTTQEKAREIEVSVTDFGADPTGAVACDSAFAAAQASLPLTGGTIKFPRGRYRVTSSTGLTIGNALPSNPSTLNGVKIKGDGWGRCAQTMNASDAATVIFYDGPSSGRLINVAGPISGVVIEDLMLDGNGKNVVLYKEERAFHLRMSKVLMVNWCNNFAMEIGASTPLGPTYGGAAPIDHLYEQVVMQSPGVGAHSVDIGNGNGNLNQLCFLRCYFDRYNDTGTYGVRLGYCDHIQFIACHVAMTGSIGSGGISYMVRAQPGVPNFPQNIEVLGGSQAGGVSFDNTLETWNAGPYAAIIFNTYKTADGAPVPPKTANGGIDAPPGMFAGMTDNGLRIGWWGDDQQAITTAATIAPVKPVVLLSGAGTITNITPPRAIFSVPLGGYRLTLIAQGSGINLGTGGNIAESLAMTNLRAVELIFSEGTGFWSRVGS